MPTVAQLFPQGTPPAISSADDQIGSIKVPGELDDPNALQHVLEVENLLAASRAVWMGFPSLRDAADKLIEKFTTAWPSLNGETPASVKAVVMAIRSVESGLQRGESSREFVVANFLKGLGTVADDVVHIHAWGMNSNRSVEVWASGGRSFSEWAADGRFDEIRFFKRSSVPQNEIEGTRWKIMCDVASARDIGAMTRFR